MEHTGLRILLVGCDEETFALVQERLSTLPDCRFFLEWVSSYRSGLKTIRKGRHDVILVEARLGERTGLDLLQEADPRKVDAPMIILADREDREEDLATMKAGAAYYLVKSELDASHLERSIRYAIEHQRRLSKHRELSIVDDLTGLNNRRGFLALANQQLKMADRNRIKMYLLFADLDELKMVNDIFGHHQGDQALIDVAGTLEETFRRSDVMARIGGDEFVVLTSGGRGEYDAALTDRFRETLSKRNDRRQRPFSLSVSLGVACYDPADPCGIYELLERADASMYKEKRDRKRPTLLIRAS